MKIIVGLGNPEKKYEGTRHNVGFATLDRLAETYQIAVDTKKFQGLIGKGVIGGEKVILVKPLTYMNLSGNCVREVAEYFRVEAGDILVIFDDISLIPGQIRIRPKGSAGGHNGIKSIIANLGSQEFPRIKCGVGEKPKGSDLADWVLGHFNNEDKRLVDEAMDRAVKAVECILTEGVDAAMNRYN